MNNGQQLSAAWRERLLAQQVSGLRPTKATDAPKLLFLLYFPDG